MAIVKKGLSKFWHYAHLPIVAVLVIWGGFVLAEVNWPVSQERSDAAVAAIHAQRLTMADVDGTNLPPAPDPKKNNATIAGIDANENGIRDDVELAIFAEYPDNKKVRAAGLQYAMSLQDYLVEVMNSETWTAAAQEKSRAQSCVFGVFPGSSSLRNDLISFVHEIVVNTDRRRHAEADSEGFAASFKIPRGAKCDLEIS